ncbi:IS3 family transposase [Microbispora sp. NPDC046933]|uniref:IS3 family transposase n=1 Tax=Microbispora sp. NPDC046933 TaxID=3155618 RepID=UPI0033E8D86E
MGAAGRPPRSPDPDAAKRPDLISRDFQPEPDGVDTRWCGDITYIATYAGWLYLATVIGIASRRVVGWATADHLRTELVADALQQAWRNRRPTTPVILHSDRGCQYTSTAYTRLAERLGVRLSAGRRGQCWDNALAESFFATIKAELLDERRRLPARPAALSDGRSPGPPAARASVSSERMPTAAVREGQMFSGASPRAGGEFGSLRRHLR